MQGLACSSEHLHWRGTIADQVLENMLLDLQQSSRALAANPGSSVSFLNPHQSLTKLNCLEIGEGPELAEQPGFAARVLLLCCKPRSILSSTVLQICLPSASVLMSYMYHRKQQMIK